MKVLALSLISGAVFFFSLVFFRVLSRAYQQYRQRYLAKSIRELDGMFLFVEPRQLLLLNLSSMVLLGIAALLIFSPLAAVIGVVVGFFLPRVAVRRSRKRRVRKFNVQLVDGLQSLANAFRAGLTFPQAVEQLAREMPAPLSQEFGLLIKELRLGLPLEEALVNMGARVGSEDLDLVVVATNIARQLGGGQIAGLDGLGNASLARGGAQLHPTGPDPADAPPCLRLCAGCADPGDGSPGLLTHSANRQRRCLGARWHSRPSWSPRA